MKVLPSGKVVGIEELEAASRALVDWMSNSSSGHITAEFGRILASYLGMRYGIPVNSGSSANLLVCAAVLNPGDEVLTTALNFPTTLAPILQCGAKPVFIDVSLDGFVPTFEQVKKALTRQTKAIVLAHTLGYPFPADRLRKLCDERNIILIEDNCDGLGSKIGGHRTGSFGHISTLSFYSAHHITTWEGGMVLTDNPNYARKIRSMRDWGRSCYCDPGQDNACGHRFDGDYDHKYCYSYPGYNLKMPDILAAIGVAQLNRLENFISTRRANHMHLASRAHELGLERWFTLPAQNINHTVSWFGYALLCGENVNRNGLARYLDSKGVGSRPMMGGNLIRQKAFSMSDFRLAEELTNTDIIHERGLWIGVWPGLEEQHLNFAIDQIYEYVRNNA